MVVFIIYYYFHCYFKCCCYVGYYCFINLIKKFKYFFILFNWLMFYYIFNFTIYINY
ncbi:MAG: hypothetical protein Q8830_00735 [Candidatus Phytoplasma australasiaticum]|nr:hypothetical protein [Candidatus Phytoplasma australasiaticum]